MNILIVGGAIEKWMSIELIYRRYLERRCGCTIFPAENMFRDYYDKSVLHKILFRLGLSRIYRRINRRLLEAVAADRPDVVWVFKGMEIFPETLRALKAQGIFICNYNPDHPFIHTGKGSGNSLVVRAFPEYPLHFVYGTEFRKQCAAKGIRAELLPFAYDLSLFEDKTELFREPELYNRLCFVGNPDAERAAFITSLLERGVSIDLYGHHWERHFNGHPQAKLCGPVYGKELWKTFRRYRVQLNLLRVHNLDAHNQRSFELAGAGAIQLAPDTPDHRHFFKPGSEIFLFRDADDCAAQIRVLLGMDAEAAAQIRRQVLEAVRRDGHDYEARAETVYRTLLRETGG